MKLYEYIDKAIYNYASCYDAPDTSNNEEFSDALVDVIDLIRDFYNSSYQRQKVGTFKMERRKRQKK